MKHAATKNFAAHVATPLAALCVAWVLLVWLWPVSALTLAYDDAYYYLQIARNAAHGYGFTYDRLHVTDGYHPLWMWTLVPIARVFGDNVESFARVVITFQLVMVFGCTTLLIRSLSRGVTGWQVLFAVLLLSGSHFTKVVVNGLESALEYALLVSTVLLLTRFETEARQKATIGDAILLAFVLALLTLTRLTMALLAIPSLLWSISRIRARSVVLRAFAPLAVYACLVGAYVLPHRFEFGHWLTVNAAIKATEPGGTVAHRLLCLLAAYLVTGVSFALLARPWRRPRDLRPHVAFVLAFALVQSGLDALVRGRLIPEIWVLVPQATLVVILLCASPPFESRLARWGTASLLVLANLWGWVQHVKPNAYAWYAAGRAEGDWIARNTPTNAIVAGYMGITGAFSERRFVNLAGLVNTWRFKEEYLDRGRWDAYLDEAGVDYFAEPLDVTLFDAPGSDIQSVAWAHWAVRYLSCSTLSTTFSLRNDTTVALVMSRKDAGPSLLELLNGRGGNICAGPDIDR